MSNYQTYKQEVVDTCHALLNRGYLKATEGNISARVKDQNAFAITPSNYDYAKMQVDDICILDYETKTIEGTMKPSIESGMHAAVYQNRADVHCIIHTHQPYASALALIKMPIPALFDEQVRFLGRSVDIIPYAPSGTGFLKNAVKAKVKTNANAYILTKSRRARLRRDDGTGHSQYGSARKMRSHVFTRDHDRKKSLEDTPPHQRNRVCQITSR
jgi:glutamate-1-semialdehyde 2,1-aminomutase